MRASELSEKIEEAAATTSYSWSLYKSKPEVSSSGRLSPGPNGALTSPTTPSYVDGQLEVPRIQSVMVADGDPWSDETSDGFNNFIDGMKSR